MAGDADGIAELDAENAVLMVPNEDALVGGDAIGARWTQQLSLPDLAFTLHPQELIVSASGDLAFDRGT